MSRHDYSKYSNNKKYHAVDETASYQGQMSTADAVVDVASFETEVVIPDIEAVVEAVDVTVVRKTVPGVVADCNKLNVRVAPNSSATVICVLDVGTEIEVNVTDSTDEWFSICTAAGIEGYCMRKFVNARA